jgi:flagellar basal body L-ring protein FlgH
MDSRPRDDVARMWILAAAFALGTAACGPPHISAFTPRERNFVAGRYAEDEPGAKPTAGSLFSDAKTGLFQDPLAGHVGDILSIKIDESADAQGDSTTSLSRKSSMSAGVDTFFGS